MWLDAVDCIYLINLQKRTDRLIKSAEQFENYEIPYKVFPAIEKPNGAEGLRDTMVKLFTEAVEKNYSHIIVFEDDVKFVEEKYHFHETMKNVIKQIPDNYLLCYLGGQPTAGYSHFHSTHLLPAVKYYSTQSVMYSRSAMINILSMGMGFPIDNWLVDEIQTQGNCYAVHPILCSQFGGYSDIGGTEMDWNPFIVNIHEQKITQMKRHG